MTGAAAASPASAHVSPPTSSSAGFDISTGSHHGTGYTRGTAKTSPNPSGRKGQVTPGATSGTLQLSFSRTNADDWPNCNPTSYYPGGQVRFCDMWFVGTTVQNATISWNQTWKVVDACGATVINDTWNATLSSFWYNNYGNPTYSWDKEIVPANEPAACLGTWTLSSSVTATSSAGGTLTDGGSNTFVVDGVGAAVAPPAAQTIGGTSNHGSAGDPVDTFTGAFNYHPGADLTRPSLGSDLSFGRSYASNDSTSGVFGAGWSNSYDDYLSTDPATGNVARHAPTGSQQVFASTGTSYTAPPQVHDTLVKNTDGTFTLSGLDQVHRSYDTAGRLVAVQDRNGQGPALGYNASGQLVTVTGSGRSLAFTYTGNLLTKVTTNDGRSVSYGYTGSLLTTVTDPAGAVTTYGYDAQGHLNSVKDPLGNYTVRLVYDTNTSRVTSQQDALGNTSTYAWDPGTTTATVTDPRAKISKDVYTNGFLTQSVDPLGHTLRYNWSHLGQLATISDPLGNTTEFAYDTSGNEVSRYRPANNGGDGAGQSFSYNATNDVTYTGDFGYSLYSFGYDTTGNQTSVGNSGGATMLTRTFNANGTIASSTNSLGGQSLFAYDPNGQLSAVTDPASGISTFGRDPAGRVTSVTDPRGNVTGANAAAYTTTTTYDADGRPLSVTDGTGRARAVTYYSNGWVHTMVQPSGRTVTFGYDADGHVTSIQGPDGAIPPLRYTYDANGNRLTATDPKGAVTTFAYDDANQLTSVSSAAAGTWTYARDAAGRLTSSTAPSGRTTYRTYDAEGQLTQLSYSDTTPATTYTYDSSGNVATATAGSDKYTFNWMYGHINSATHGADQYSWTYDANGRLTGRTLPGQPQETFTYDTSGRLSQYQRGTSTLASYSYDTPTATVTTTLGNGVVETRTYNAANQLTAVKQTSGSTTISAFTYTYDQDGNPTLVTDAAGKSTAYTYDTTGHLTQVCFAVSSCAGTPADYIKWTYDANGNRLTEVRPSGSTSYTYDAANRLTKFGKTGVTYDADGNMTGYGSTKYTWNAAGQLLTAGKLTFTYDPQGNRASVNNGTAVTTFVSDPADGSLAMERDSTGAVLRRYNEIDGHDIGMTTGGTDYYYGADITGSVRSVTGAAGAQQWSYAYEPFGTAKTTTKVSSTAPFNPVGFDGSYQESDASGYWLGSREYSPTFGRFTSADRSTSALPGSDFSFAMARPTIMTDASGNASTASAGGMSALDPGLPCPHCASFSAAVYINGAADGGSSNASRCASSKASCPTQLADGVTAGAGNQSGDSAGQDASSEAGCSGLMTGPGMSFCADATVERDFGCQPGYHILIGPPANCPSPDGAQDDNPNFAEYVGVCGTGATGGAIALGLVGNVADVSGIPPLAGAGVGCATAVVSLARYGKKASPVLDFVDAWGAAGGG